MNIEQKIQEAAENYRKMNVNIADVPHSVSPDAIKKWAIKDFTEGANWALSNPSEFGLVKQEDYNRMADGLKKAGAASLKLYQKALDDNEKLKSEIIHLHKVKGGMQLGIDGYQEQIDDSIRRITDLESENAKLKEALEKANDVLRSCYSVIERKGSSTNWKSLYKVVNDILKDQHKLNNQQ